MCAVRSLQKNNNEIFRQKLSILFIQKNKFAEGLTRDYPTGDYPLKDFEYYQNDYQAGDYQVNDYPNSDLQATNDYDVSSSDYQPSVYKRRPLGRPFPSGTVEIKETTV